MINLNLAKTLVIYGCGGHARSLADVALANGHTTLLFVDPMARKDERLFNFDVVQSLPAIKDFYAILAAGDNKVRAELFEKMPPNQTLVSLISSDAHIGKNVEIGLGTFVGQGAHIGPNAKIGENTIINTHCVIEHDCQIGAHSHISVNTTVAGSCRMGDFVMIGTGATVIDGIYVCSEVTIGAGAVVIQDITESGVYVGVPARKVKVEK